MSERSIAEIIGWEWSEACHAWKSPGPKWFVYRRRDDPPEVTADDLLAWLREHIHHEVWNNDHAVMIVADDDGAHVQWYSEAGIDEVEAPTLLAALEAAVRAVAEATP